MASIKWFTIVLAKLLILLTISLVGCQSSNQENIANNTLNTNVEGEPQSMLTDQPIDVQCLLITQNATQVVIELHIENKSQKTYNLINSDRLPYLIPQDNNTLLILYGINPPDPHRLYPIIEIPVTKELAPGDNIKKTIQIYPARFENHYGILHQQIAYHGPVTLHCQVGWGETPIKPRKEEKNIRNINQLLEWQHLTEAQPIQIEFP